MGRFVLSCASVALMFALASGAAAQTAAPGPPDPSPAPSEPAASPAEEATPAASPSAPSEPTPPPASPPPESAKSKSSAPPTKPATSGPASADNGTEPSAKTPPFERTLAIELDGGLSNRLGDASDYGFDTRQSGGLSYGPSVWIAPSRLWSLGLLYQRTSLGTDRSSGGELTVDVKRSLDTIWFSGRAYPWRNDSMGLFIALSLGASWQYARANGTRVTQSFLRPADTYSCSASEGPGFALGGGAGLDLDLSREIAFIAQADATGHRHTSDTIGDCAPGSGSVTSVAARIGFAYRFDLEASSESGSPRSESVSSRGNSALLR